MLDGAPAVVEDSGGGEILVAVDASADGEWVYFDFDGARAVVVSDPFTEPTWDLAFQRFRVKSNGGVSGNGNVSIAALGTEDFTQDVTSESLEWRSDSGTGTRIKYAFTEDGSWYRYQSRSHTLESRRQVILVRSTEGIIYRLQMLTYYDRLLLSGYPTFRYARS